MLRTRDELAAELRALGLAPGDVVMVHAALRSVGPMLGGGDAVIGALLDAAGPEGTIAAYADWEANYEDLLDEHGRVPMWWRAHVPPFDRIWSRAIRDNGIFPELLRTTRGAAASANPGARVVATGAKAEWLTADHAIDYGYGPASPFAKLAAVRGKVLMLGAPLDTMTLIHHAEHLASGIGQGGADAVANDAVECAAGFLRIYTLHIERPRRGEGGQNLVFGDRGERDALRVFEVQRFGKVPRNRLPFAVGVGGQNHAIGLLDCGLELGQHATAALGRLIGQFKCRRL